MWWLLSHSSRLFALASHRTCQAGGCDSRFSHVNKASSHTHVVMPDVQRLSSHPSVVKTLGDLFTPPPSLTHFERVFNFHCLIRQQTRAAASLTGARRVRVEAVMEGVREGYNYLYWLEDKCDIYICFFTSGTHFTLLMGGRNGVCGKVLCRRCTDIFPVEGCGGRWGRGSYYMSQTNMGLYICIAIVRLLKNHKNMCLYLRETEL